MLSPLITGAASTAMRSRNIHAGGGGKQDNSRLFAEGYFLFGSETEIKRWAVAQMLEIIAVLAPHLDARFATSVDEVTFPSFRLGVNLGRLLVLSPIGQTEFQQPCQRRGNGAYSVMGPLDPREATQTMRTPVGLPITINLSEQSDLNRSDLNWIRNKVVGQEVNNPAAQLFSRDRACLWG